MVNHLDQTKLVITGMGAVTPIGNDVPTFWQSLKDGKCGIGPITRFDVSDYKVKLAAEVKDFDISQYVEGREAKRMDKSSHFAIAAAQQAVDQAGLTPGTFNPYRTGVIYGSGIGGLYITETEVEKLISKGSGRVSPFAIPELIPNIVAAHLSMRFGFQGENYCPVSACATANHAIGEAMRAIRHGYQDIVLCGGTENGIIPFSLAGFQNMKALHTGDDPTAASIPFDARRSGFVMGEGRAHWCSRACRTRRHAVQPSMPRLQATARRVTPTTSPAPRPRATQQRLPFWARSRMPD